MKHVEIDKDTCIGCGNCESVCPEVFELGSMVKSTVTEEYRTEEEYLGEVPDDIECLEKAEDECPVDAISVE